MSVFALSDLHLSTNTDTDKSMEVFGARWKDYTEKIKRNWEHLIAPEDTVILPGDISWAMTLEEAREDFAFLDALPGTKILGKGNHDFWWATQKKIDTFLSENFFHSIRFLYNNAHRVENFVIAGSRGWYNDEHQAGIPDNTDFEKIVNREVIRLRMSLDAAAEFPKELERLVFLHFPPVFRDFRSEEIVGVLREYGIRRCFFGHIHGFCDFPKVFCENGIEYHMISADQVDFTPQFIAPCR